MVRIIVSCQWKKDDLIAKLLLDFWLDSLSIRFYMKYVSFLPLYCF